MPTARIKDLSGCCTILVFQLGAPFGIAIPNLIAISTNGNGGGAMRGGSSALMKGFRNAYYAMIAMGLFGFLLAWGYPAVG